MTEADRQSLDMNRRLAQIETDASDAKDAIEREVVARFDGARREGVLHDVAHSAAHLAHERQHEAEHAFVIDHWAAHAREHESDTRTANKADEGNAHAVAAALASVEKANVQARAALSVALEDHHREHTVHEVAHSREHAGTEQALAKAEVATEKRFESVNEFREQLRTQAATLASRDSVEAIVKEMDRRFNETARFNSDRWEAQGRAITAIEKGDVKQEGRGIGQVAVIAAIVTSVGLVGGLLGIIIVIANFATKT